MGRLMKALQILGCVALLCFIVPIKITDDDSPVEQFNNFLQKYNKSYSNKTEYFIRLGIFQVLILTIFIYSSK